MRRIVPFALVLLVLAACQAPLTLPTQVRLDSVSPDAGTTGTPVALTGVFTDDVSVEVCGVAIDDLAFEGGDVAVIAPGITGHGPGYVRATGTIPQVPGATVCDVVVLANGVPVAGAVATFTTEAVANMIVASRRQLEVLLVAADGSETITTAELPGEHLAPTQTIFGLAWHPAKPWLYVTSSEPWGYARIDVFAWTGGALDHVATNAFVDYPELTCVSEIGPRAAIGVSQTTYDDSCAPTELAFSPDGALLYVNEDNRDRVLTFEVDAVTGALALVDQGVMIGDGWQKTAEVWYQGLVAHPTAPVLYNGLNVLAVDANGIPANLPAPGQATYGDGGNTPHLVPTTGGLRLLTTVENRDIGLLALNDPEVPAVLGRISGPGSGGYEARALSPDPDGARVAVVGDNVAWVASFADDALAMVGSVPVDEAEEVRTVIRGVTWVPGTDLFVAAWFADSLWNIEAAGGFLVFQVDDAGTPSLVERIEGSGAAVTLIAMP